MPAPGKQRPGHFGSVRLLLEERLAPITKEVGFLEADRERIVAFFVNWQNTVVLPRTGRTTAARETSGGPESVLTQLLPLTKPRPVRHLFVPTRSDWTAYFNNSIGGTDNSSTSYIARSIGCRGLRVVAQPHTMRKQGDEWRGHWGAVMLEIYASQKITAHHNHLRSIYAANDGGRWVFGASGEVQPFEDVARYAAPRIRDRFTPEMPRSYTEALGLRPFDDSFYAPDGVATIVEERGRIH